MQLSKTEILGEAKRAEMDEVVTNKQDYSIRHM